MKPTMLKKMLSLALSATMSTAMAVPAFAAGNETVLTATYTAPTIEVTVTSAADVILNPLGLNVDLDGDKTGTTDDVVVGQQIVTKPAMLVNLTDMKLDVDVSVATALAEGSTMKLVTSEEAVVGKGSPSDSDYVAPSTAKSVFAFFQAKTTALTADDYQDDEAVNKAAAEWAYDFTPAVMGADGTTVETPANGVILSASKPATGKAVVTLEAATEDGPDEGSVALVRLSGKMTQQPKEAWSTADKLTVTVAYTFIPNTTT